MSDLLATFDLWVALVIFVSYTTVDALYAVYTKAIVNDSILMASNVGFIMYLLIGVGTINYVENPLYLIPMGLGGWLGTYASLTIMKKRQEKTNV